MSTTMESSTSTTKGEHPRRGRRLAALAASVVTAAGLALAGAGPASAAGPTSLSYYGANVDFPTWFWGSTTLCVTNRGSSYGTAKVQSWSPYAGPEYIGVAGYSTRCISRSWWGVPVNVSNISYTPLTASTY